MFSEISKRREIMASKTQALVLLISMSCLLLSINAQSNDEFSAAPSPVSEPEQTMSMISETPEGSPAPSPDVAEPEQTTLTLSSTMPEDSESSLTYDVLETSKAVDTTKVSTASFIPKGLDQSEPQVFKFVKTNMIGTMTKIEQLIDSIQKRLDKASTEDSADGLEQCKEVYQDALDDAKNILDDLSSRDLYKANVDLTAISSNVDTCEDLYKELAGGDPSFHKFGAWVRGMTGDCLDALQNFSS